MSDGLAQSKTDSNPVLQEAKASVPGHCAHKREPVLSQDLADSALSPRGVVPVPRGLHLITVKD